MKGKDGILRELTEKKVGGIDSDVIVFAFCLILSFVFWYLNSLGKDFETGIKYPVTYTGIPNERITAGDPKAKLTLYLKGAGYSIVKLRLSGKRTPVEIDISKINYKRVPGSLEPEYYIVTSGLVKSIAVQIRSGCEVTSIKPDTLFFNLQKEVVESDQETRNIGSKAD